MSGIDSRTICASINWHSFSGRGSDYSLDVFDLNRGSNKQTTTYDSAGSIYETTIPAEKIFDVAWLRLAKKLCHQTSCPSKRLPYDIRQVAYRDPNVFCVSTARSLRLADWREKSGFVSTASVHSTQLGIIVEPINGTHIAVSL